MLSRATKALEVSTFNGLAQIVTTVPEDLVAPLMKES